MLYMSSVLPGICLCLSAPNAVPSLGPDACEKNSLFYSPYQHWPLNDSALSCGSSHPHGADVRLRLASWGLVREHSLWWVIVGVASRNRPFTVKALEVSLTYGLPLGPAYGDIPLEAQGLGSISPD